MEGPVTAARITVRVTPRAARNEIDGWSEDGTLRVHVTAAPTDGKANAAVLRLIAKTLGIPARDVRLISGSMSRTKIVEIDGPSVAEVRARLGVSGAADAS